MNDFRYHVERCYLDLIEEGTIDTAVDRLPYTPGFEHLSEAVRDQYPEKTDNEIWLALNGRRKQGGCKLKEKTESEKRRLTFTQVKVLRMLLNNPKGLTREQIVKKYGKRISLTSVLGPTYIEDIDESGEKYKRYSLIGMSYVVGSQLDPDDRSVTYQITDAGRKALKVAES